MRRRVLRELRAIESGDKTLQSPVMEEFERCPDWQLASQIVSRALDAASREAVGVNMELPPAWLPPIL